MELGCWQGAGAPLVSRSLQHLTGVLSWLCLAGLAGFREERQL